MPKLIPLLTILFIACQHTPEATEAQEIGEFISSTSHIERVYEEGKTIMDRFTAPSGFTTAISDTNSFANYLQNLPLKPEGTLVKYYDGSEKPNHHVYAAVVDMDIDAVDLQQCADAVMRLRGEHLYAQKRYSEIKFNFLSDGKPRYYKDYAKGDYSYKKFRKYMKYIFSYANTASMCDELAPRPIADVQIGDVLVQKGRPYGHAVIVVNLASNADGKKKMMLAQSYMPAQETQVLLNPNDTEVWYDVTQGQIQTPEWTFSSSDLKHF